MGMLADIAEWISELPLPKHFSVCELGDQYLTEPKEGRLSRDWFERELKCGRYVSVDANARGDVTADLNRPLDHVALGEFDLVTDLGTGEHVFNQHQFWKTVHHLTRVGGFIVFDKPHQGYAEHGFYTYSETFFSDIAYANEYRLIRDGYRDMPRGKLYRGVWQRKRRGKFVVPQQGRYLKDMRIG